MRETIAQDKSHYEKQQAEVARMREEIAKIMRAKEMEEQQRREAEERRRQEQLRVLEEQKRVEEERRKQLELARLEEQRRIEEAKRRLEEEKRQLELDKQRALAQLQAPQAAAAVPVAAAAAPAAAAQGGNGAYLDLHQANTEYSRTANDFGTPAGQPGPGDNSLYFKPGHPQFSPGFYPEFPDYGSLFSLAKPRAGAPAAPAVAVAPASAGGLPPKANVGLPMAAAAPVAYGPFSSLRADWHSLTSCC